MSENTTFDQLAGLMRVRPELQDFCRFGGEWHASHQEAEAGWAAFHIVTKGQCQIERNGAKPLCLEAGDVLLLPHGDGHVIYSGINHRRVDLTVVQRDHIRVKQGGTGDFDTELICGRFHLVSGNENLVLRALPEVVVLKLGGERRYAELVRLIRDELEEGRAGAASVASDLSSALFVMLLRQHLESEPPARGLFALLTSRETSRAAAAIIRDPAYPWTLGDLASIAVASRSTLVRAFGRLTGMAPLTFLLEIRLTLARNRIMHSDTPLAEVAAAVGYQSEAALSRALLRRFGMRPGAMRRAQRTGAEHPNSTEAASPGLRLGIV